MNILASAKIHNLINIDKTVSIIIKKVGQNDFAGFPCRNIQRKSQVIIIGLDQYHPLHSQKLHQQVCGCQNHSAIIYSAEALSFFLGCVINFHFLMFKLCELFFFTN